MILVLVLDLICIAILVYTATKRGFQQALPVATFFLVLFPEESKIPTGFFDLTTQRLVILTLFALTFFTKTGTRVGPRKLPLRTGVIALSLWWVLSAVASLVPDLSLKAVLSQIFDYFIVYFIFVRYLSSTEIVNKVLFGMAAAMSVCALFGAIENYGQWTVVSLFPTTVHRFGVSGHLYIDKARGLRVKSTFGHPILFGSAIAMTVPIALYLLSLKQSQVRKVLLWIGILLMFGCIYKTGSRGPWMALAGSLGLFLVFAKDKMRKYVIAMAVLAMLVLLARPGVLATLVANYVGTMDSHSYEGESYQYRYVLYDLAIDALDQSPNRALLGYGPQSFPFLHLSGSINGRVMAFASCDSSFAALLIETGYVGFLIAVFLLFAPLIRTVRMYRELRWPTNGICIILFASLAAYYFEMTSVAILGWGQQNFMLWIIIAITMVYPYLLAAEKKEGLAHQPGLAAAPGVRWFGESSMALRPAPNQILSRPLTAGEIAQNENPKFSYSAWPHIS